jgi:hypothetical protein
MKLPDSYRKVDIGKSLKKRRREISRYEGLWCLVESQEGKFDLRYLEGVDTTFFMTQNERGEEIRYRITSIESLSIPDDIEDFELSVNFRR